MESKTRRTFFKIMMAGIVAFFMLAWNKLTLNHINIASAKKSKFPFNKNKTITFLDNYIMVSKNDRITVFAARCSHLGCKINKSEYGKLVCPCHGSEYNLNGEVLKGPAYKNLEIIPSKISADGKSIEIGA